MTRYLRHRLARLLELPEVPAEDYIWSGIAAMTGDFLPRLFELKPGLLAVIGCNGRGIAMTASLGVALADFLTGARAAPPVPITKPRPKRLHWLVRQAPRVYISLARLKDRRDSGWA